jgi:hypothetical protein
MNKKSILALEKIISDITELKNRRGRYENEK